MNSIFLAVGANPNAGIINIGMIVLMIFIFWFFIIRPNNKKQKELQKQRDALGVNDKVIISDGIMGTIKDIKRENGYALVEIAEGVRVRVSMQSIFPLEVGDNR